MSKKQEFINSDTGKVIFNTATNCYYCGMNTFKNQLRDVKIYHSDKFLNDAIQTLINSNKLRSTDIAIKTVEVKITGSIMYTDMVKY